MVVPFAPGGATDVLARLIGQRLNAAWGQSVVVENRTGAGGNIGADVVAKARPDGYTLLMGAIGPNAANAALYATMPYDIRADFEPITLVATVPSLVVVHPSLGVGSISELLDLARGRPDGINAAHGGVGGSQHLATLVFEQMTGVRFVQLSYRGFAPAVPDLLNGRVQLAFADMTAVLQHVRSGALRALAVTSARRSPVLPDVATVAEAGVPGYDVSAWYGVFAPARTPAEIVRAVRDEIARNLQAGEIASQIEGLGGLSGGNSPAEFAAFVRTETSRWQKIITTAGVRAE
jgi:tripartite-type tricarboxylate transporter receptor subunit TctC